jgi:signal transduction histidine kinase
VKLARKVLVPQFLLLGLIGVLVSVQAYISQREQEILQTTTERLQETATSIQRLTQLFTDVERDLLAEQLRPDQTLRRRIVNTTEEVDRLLAGLRSTDWTYRGRLLLDDLIDLRPETRDSQTAVLDRLHAQQWEEARRDFVSWWALDQRSSAMLADLSVYNLKRLDRGLAHVQAVRRRYDLGVIWVALLCAAVVGLSAAYVLRGIVRPLVQLTEASTAAGGPNPEAIPRFVGRSDEVETLSVALADTTERLVGANRNLASALNARDQFLSVAAHELRTPLTSLLLQVQLLKRGLEPTDKERLTRAIWSTERQVIRVNDLVNDLLDVTRIQAGRLDLHLENVPLEGLIREVCARCAPLLDSGGNSLRLSLQPDLVCQADPSRLEQVLVNLLANAARHAPGAPVEVSLVAEEGQPVVRVHDDGPGVSEPVRERMFERFVRTPHSKVGLGLGLYICKQIVEAHGGRIDVESAPGEGTTFSVRLSPDHPLPEARERPAVTNGPRPAPSQEKVSPVRDVTGTGPLELTPSDSGAQ